jgi:RNase P/RNase MRP subunit p29
MIHRTRALAAVTAILGATALTISACGAIAGGPKKIVFNETICANQAVVRMTVGETRRLVMDNAKYSSGQNGMTVRLTDVPLVIKGDVPKNSIIGDPFSTVVLSAPAGEETRVDVVPTRSGTYPIQCGAIIGNKSQVFDMTLQILPAK